MKDELLDCARELAARTPREPLLVAAPLATVWVAYYLDWSGFGIFSSEIEALRFACDASMSVAMIVMPCPDIKAEVAKQKAKAGV